jgi:hypothetical protein
VAPPPQGASAAPAAQQPVPEAEQPGQKPKPAAGKPHDKKKDSDEQKPAEENSKQER